MWQDLTRNAIDIFAYCEDHGRRTIRAEVSMYVIGTTKLQEFWTRHPQAKSPLQEWHQAVQSTTWEQFADVRKTYPNADRVGRCYVFNIGGNKYRLIASIDFPAGRVFIREMLTHAEYDKNKWRRHC